MEQSYTDSAYYNIRLTSRYIKLFTTQLLKKIAKDISSDEMFTLDILKKHGNMSQRDLAKMLFRDRANTGKIANSLMKKGLINISSQQKNNRMIKELSLSKQGEDFLNEISQKSQSVFNEINSKFSREENEKLNDMLLKLRTAVQSVTEIQI